MLYSVLVLGEIVAILIMKPGSICKLIVLCRCLKLTVRLAGLIKCNENSSVSLNQLISSLTIFV